jgi:hypothetical protein
MKLIHFVFAILFLNSCGSNEKKDLSETPKDHPQTENFEVVYPDEFNSLVSKLKPQGFPFKVDSAYLKKMDASRFTLIDNPTALRLFSNFKASEKYKSYYFEELMAMNLRKQNSTYESYVAQLDLAMLKDVNAYAMARLEHKDTGVVIWGIEYSSYEACPYYTGWEIYTSVINQGKVISCVKVGGAEDSGDPPVASSMRGLFLVNKDLKLIRTNYSYYTDDMANENPEKERYSDTLLLR